MQEINHKEYAAQVLNALPDRSSIGDVGYIVFIALHSYGFSFNDIALISKLIETAARELEQ